MEQSTGKRNLKKEKRITTAAAVEESVIEPNRANSIVASLRRLCNEGSLGKEGDDRSIDSSIVSDRKLHADSRYSNSSKEEDRANDKSVVDKVEETRRQNRLARNRESARNRRKRKKLLIESLESQNTELTRTNQSFQLANESLSAKIQVLQSELSVARATINQLQLSLGSLSLEQPLSLSGRGMPVSLLSGSPRIIDGRDSVARLSESLTGQQYDDITLNEVMQTQLNRIESQQFRQLIGSNDRLLPSTTGIRSTFSPNDQIIPRYNMDNTHAFSQENRGHHVEQLMMNNSFRPGGYQNQNTLMTCTVSVMHPEQHQNTLARSTHVHRLGSLGGDRVNNIQYASAASVRCPDAVVARGVGDDNTNSDQMSTRQQILDGLGRQGNISNQSNFPPY